MNGEAFAFFHWHRFMRPVSKPCDKWTHSYHLTFWKWGYR